MVVHRIDSLFVLDQLNFSFENSGEDFLWPKGQRPPVFRYFHWNSLECLCFRFFFFIFVTAALDCVVKPPQCLKRNILRKILMKLQCQVILDLSIIIFQKLDITDLQVEHNTPHWCHGPWAQASFKEIQTHGDK